ncbi:hypothetical protein GCM10027413_20380 [Conyzicola nivalis]|uniref:histidine kinase n=2 Tax=Conyzicola nivalis TaxID=1477021 RepID=A0A916SCL7_9MICO|nr:hypothetical protein GCM10010979_06240 [Conyzicola nivalis]
MMRHVPLPDWAWAIISGVASIAYFLITIETGTSFFEANGGPSVSALSVWGSVALFAVQAVPMIWRTRAPVLCFVLVYLCFLAAVYISIDRNLTITITFLFAIFNLAALTPWRTWGAVLGAAFAVDLAVHLVLAAMSIGALPPVAVLATLIRIVPSYVTPILAGLLYGSQRRRAELAAEAANAQRQARDGQLAAAVAEERNRMARELHDVAAHHLSGILLQTKAAIRVQTSNPSTTAELLESINSEGELTLQNLREVVGVLREDDETGAVSEPTLSRLPDLIESVRTLHPAIDLTVEGDIDDLSPATSLACYRIIQESLTNVRKHAPGAYVAIHVDRSAREVVLTVSNSAPPTDDATAPSTRAGHGVVGMRERATMLGGRLDSGRTPDGGWQTRAVIPIERRPVS